MHLNGFEKHFRRCVRSRGRRVTAHSASAFQAWTLLWRIFGIRRSIIERDPFVRSIWRCLRSTVLRTRNRGSLEAFFRPCRDSTYFESVYPALKRWAICEFAKIRLAALTGFASFASQIVVVRLLYAKVMSSPGLDRRT